MEYFQIDDHKESMLWIHNFNSIVISFICPSKLQTTLALIVNFSRFAMKIKALSELEIPIFDFPHKNASNFSAQRMPNIYANAY